MRIDDDRALHLHFIVALKQQIGSSKIYFAFIRPDTVDIGGNLNVCFVLQDRWRHSVG